MASGWWDNNGAIAGCVAAYQPIGAASLAASYVNLANPGTLDAYAGNAPTFDAAIGWTFNGSKHLRTAIVPPGDGQCTIIARFSDRTGTTSQQLWGLSEASGGLQYTYAGTVQDGYGGRIFYNGRKSNYTYANGPLDSGVLAINADAAYVDGAFYLTLGGGHGAATLAQGLGIGGVHYWDPGYTAWGNSFVGKMQAFAYYNVSLSAGDIATISAAMALQPVSGQPAALRGIFVPGMTTGGRRIIGAGWGG